MELDAAANDVGAEHVIDGADDGDAEPGDDAGFAVVAGGGEGEGDGDPDGRGANDGDHGAEAGDDAP
jgi:hypothetical protein